MENRIAVVSLLIAAGLLLGADIAWASPLADHPPLVRLAYPTEAGQVKHLIVSPSGPYTTIEAALAEAKDGDVIEVHGGAYPALVVEKSVTLEGLGWPAIDGGGQGTVVTLNAAGVVFRGFEVRGSGVEPDRDHAGITLAAPDIVVENNRLYDVLFGIFVAQADNAILRGNDITSKTEYDVGRKGDGIRLWYSQNVTVEQNRVHDSRDVVMWYSGNVVVRDNLIESGRYGIHLMYCDGARIEGNQVYNNSVGIYTMYSNHVVLRENDIRGQRGPSGYALGFKDADFVEVTDNLLVDNRAGAFTDGTPFSPNGYAIFSGNVFAFNDVGIILLAAVRGNTFQNNTFWENVEQVALQGGGKPGDNTWQGNYWSDYTGFDADDDGQGDTPYNAERFFENLTDREPLLRALIYSPAAQTIEFAASSFPIVKPQPKLVDSKPRMSPAALPPWAMTAEGQPREMAAWGMGLVAASTLLVVILLWQGGRVMRKWTSDAAPASGADSATHGRGAIHVEKLTKRYGRQTVLDEVSFETRPGEALALWGPNGAGKTTLIKAMLGLVDCSGRIEVQGHDVRLDGKSARRSIGYVPQEANFYDMSVRATMLFYARLKNVDPDRIEPLLAKLGLAEHSNKPVPALSGGLKQRLALVVALLADPPVLLLDEPTANLDAAARRDYLKLLSRLSQEQKTIVFASHRLEEVEALADRVLVMEGGCIVDVLTPGETRLRLAPHVELTLWVAESERPRALACFEKQGWNARLNGHGTVVVLVGADQKIQPLNLLAEQGISVLDFEMERGQPWN